MQQPLTNIKLRGQRQRRLATAILAKNPVKISSPQSLTPVRVVCISDTHNTRPVLPPGDVLIHAGDLTENGSFDEVQAGIAWLSSQPHSYKIFVAGNHDVLLDDKFLERYPERRYGQTKTKADLDWGNALYLEDSTVTLTFPKDGLHTGRRPTSSGSAGGTDKRSLTVFGSPWTPQYGISAFQYHPDSHSHWGERLGGLAPDIVVTHGPPKLHLDSRDFHRAGCAYLAEHIARIRPLLVVFGHIRASYGREDVVLDAAQRAYEEVMIGWSGWETVAWMAALVLWARLKWLVRGFTRQPGKSTSFVNAAVVGGPKNELRNPPIVVEL
ncbi:phosphoesterase [Coniochaeta ligniaria NRRL 30616]|uniref:Phosphoesterase n=1 Tax=Coniochaeta ligniaria NRRL 30616 TaxID=1408157 RepID=A0A1J7J4I4_9PEZI|nr:phosphoesterase [Coniochaeta ligniaria NRRL 30616]